MVFAKLDAFFDRPKVQAALDRKNRRVLGGTGAAARTFVKRSMRPAGKKGNASAPGEPPRYRTKLLRDGIAFSYDQASGSVVIGPRALSRNKPNGRSNRATIPELLELGGRVSMKGKTSIYRPRPYVGEQSAAFAYAQKVMREKMQSIPMQ